MLNRVLAAGATLCALSVTAFAGGTDSPPSVTSTSLIDWLLSLIGG